MNYAIKTENLCKEYGKEMKVKDLALRVPKGCVYGFLGPNGAGKSTTMKMILGLVAPTEGQISVLGKPMDRANRISILKKTGSLIESPSYYGHLSAAENLDIVCKLKNASSKEINEVLDIVQLDASDRKKVSHYSLGMKQRLGIAAALIGHPKLLLLDEPTNGLDPAGIQEIRELICELPAQHGITVLVSSHLLSEIDQMASMVGIIDHGELLFQGELHELHDRSRPSIHLRTMNNTEAEALLSSLKISSSLENGKLVIPALPDDTIAEIIALLSDHHVGITRVEEHKKSLEDIFLDITQRRILLPC